MAHYFVKSNGVTIEASQKKSDCVAAYMTASCPKQLIEINGKIHRVTSQQLWVKSK